MPSPDAFGKVVNISGKLIFFIFEVLILLPTGGFAGFMTMVLVIGLTSITEFLEFSRYVICHASLFLNINFSQVFHK